MDGVTRGDNKAFKADSIPGPAGQVKIYLVYELYCIVKYFN